jgi:hypothetical protein
MIGQDLAMVGSFSFNPRRATTLAWNPKFHLPGSLFALNLPIPACDQGAAAGGRAVLKRFVKATIAFVSLIIPGAFAMALLAAPPARPAAFQPQGCPHNLQAANARVAAFQAQVREPGAADRADMCKQTRLYFLEVVKARAMTALCAQGPDRERALGRFDANVSQINERIAVACN